MPNPPPSSAPPIAKPVHAASLFAALGDATRLSLLIVLRSGTARSIARLSTNAGMTRQAVTKHLRVLQATGFVHAERVGRETHYLYDADALNATRNALDAIAGNWTAVRASPAAPNRCQP